MNEQELRLALNLGTQAARAVEAPTLQDFSRPLGRSGRRRELPPEGQTGAIRPPQAALKGLADRVLADGSNSETE